MCMTAVMSEFFLTTLAAKMAAFDREKSAGMADYRQV
jgi:hypothetical protein